MAESSDPSPAEESEKIIGTFMYAVSYKTYDLHHFIFTSRRLVIANSGWEKTSRVSDLAGIFGSLVVMMPMPGPNLKTLLMQRWMDVKRENRGGSAVSYDELSSEKILGLGPMGMAMHGIVSKPYDAIKSVDVSEYLLMEDYKVKFGYGLFGSAVFLIPDYSIGEFGDLVSKTPISNRLAVRTKN
jgi:hypothetical protein